jgi:hypothetical protein
LISSLLQESRVDEQVLDKTRELLEIYIEDQNTRRYINYVLENKTIDDSKLLSNDYEDSLLEHADLPLINRLLRIF